MNALKMCTCLMLSLIGLSGCVIVTNPHPLPEPMPADDSVIAEIDAAAGLMFDDAKARTFGDIAARSLLNADAQVYLVEKAMGSLMFDSAKKDVLIRLINNPYFTQEGKKAVLDHLDEIMFDRDKETILKAISRRGRIPYAEELRMIQPKPVQPPQAPEPQSPAVETSVTVEYEAGFGETR